MRILRFLPLVLLLASAQLHAQKWLDWGINPPTFGTNILFDSSAQVDFSLFKKMEVKNTTFWLYIGDYVNPTSGVLDSSGVLDAVDAIRTRTLHSIELNIHLMPGKRSDSIQSLPANLDRYQAHVTTIMRVLGSRVRRYSVMDEVGRGRWSGTTYSYDSLFYRTWRARETSNSTSLLLESGMHSLDYGLAIAYELRRVGYIDSAIAFLNSYLAVHSSTLHTYLPLKNKSDLNDLLADPVASAGITYVNALFPRIARHCSRIQLHYYNGARHLATVIGWIDKKLKESNAQTATVEVWEMGYLVTNPNVIYTVEEHAKEVARLLIELTAARASVVNYVPFYDDGVPERGILAPDGSARFTAQVYISIISALKDITDLTDFSPTPGVHLYRFFRSSEELWAGWSDDTDTTVSIPFNPKTYFVQHLDGAITQIESSLLPLTSSPVLVFRLGRAGVEENKRDEEIAVNGEVLTLNLKRGGECVLEVYTLLGERIDRQELGTVPAGEWRHPLQRSGSSGPRVIRVLRDNVPVGTITSLW